MSDEATWAGWVERHALLFCWEREADLARLSAWATIFARAGRTPAELVRASEHMAAGAPPQFRSEHLRGLRAALLELKQQAREAMPAQREECKDCRGTGRVVVPRLGRQPLLANGKPYQATAAVICSCFLGDWYYRSLADYKSRPTSLCEYEKLNPDWRAQEVEADLLRQAEREAAGVDSVHGVIRAIARRSRDGV